MYGLYVYERNVCLFLKNILYRLHCAVIATLIKAGKEEATILDGTSLAWRTCEKYDNLKSPKSYTGLV